MSTMLKTSVQELADEYDAHYDSTTLEQYDEDRFMRAAVELLAAEIDQQYPGWFIDLDLHRFNITSPERCVFGQTISPIGGYLKGMVGLRKAGFDGKIYSHAMACICAQSHWVDAITERKASPHRYAAVS